MSDLQLYLNADATPSCKQNDFLRVVYEGMQASKNSLTLSELFRILLQFADVTAYIVTCILHYTGCLIEAFLNKKLLIV